MMTIRHPNTMSRQEVYHFQLKLTPVKHFLTLTANLRDLPGDAFTEVRVLPGAFPNEGFVRCNFTLGIIIGERRSKLTFRMSYGPVVIAEREYDYMSGVHLVK